MKTSIYKDAFTISFFIIACYGYGTNTGTINANSGNQGNNEIGGNANFGDEEQKDRKLFNFYNHCLPSFDN